MIKISVDIQKAIAIAIVTLIPIVYIFFLDGQCGKITSPWMSIEECVIPRTLADKS